MQNETFKAWMFQDDQDRLVGTMYTEQLRQVLGAVLPETLPQELPILFPSLEVAEAYVRLNWRFRGMRLVPVNCDDCLTAFVMVQAVTEDGCWLVVNYKNEEGTGGEWQPISPPHATRSRQDLVRRVQHELKRRRG